MKFIGYCLRQSLFFNLLTVFILILGILSLFSTRREAFPLVVMDMMTVITTYPGSAPKEVEKLITIPVERALKEVDGIDKLHSTSIEGRSAVIVTIDEDLSSREKEKVKTDVQRAIDRIEDLPEDVDKPIVTEIKSHQQPTIEVNLSGLEEIELRKYADILKDRLELIDDVSSVSKRGWRDREFWVEVDPRLLKKYHLSLTQIVASLNAQNINLPGGTLKQPGKEFLVRTIGEIDTPEQIENVVIRTNDLGMSTKIKDIAAVKNTLADEIQLTRIRGHKAITLLVLKRERGDSIRIVERVHKTIEAFKKIAPHALKVNTANDLSYYVKRRLNVLISNGWFGILLVLASMFLFLSRRIALITAFGIPFAFFMTFIVMRFFNMSVNLISMFGLIIVSGMLVDDAIVFSENIFRHMQKGEEPRRAAIIGSAEVIRPVLATVLTTIISFLPLAFMAGMLGKFVVQIPVIVIIALSASLFEALFILPSHCADFVSPRNVRMENPKWFEKLRDIYMIALQKALTHKYKLLGGTIAVFILALMIATQVIPFVLFPAKGIEIFLVKARAAVGTPLYETRDKMKQIEALVATLPDTELDTFTTRVGIIQRDVHDPFTHRGSHVGQVNVFLTPAADRKRTADEIVRDLQKQTAAIQGFEFLQFDKIKPGPPIGKPISVEVRGDDLAVIQEIANLYKENLKTHKGVREIEDSFEQGKRELRVIVNEPRASEAGLSVNQIAQGLRNAFEGTVATTIKKMNEEINIRVRLSEQYRNDLNVFNHLLIPNQRDNLIPLKEVAHIEEGEGISFINHYDHKRTITVTATIDPKLTTSFKINRLLQKKFKDISQKYIGYAIRYGGEQEDSQKSLRSLGKAFTVAFLGIFFILCVIFRSILQPFIVLLTLPLSVIGIVIAFLTHGQPFSFMAILGMIGLSGVVVNNAIILISLINDYRQTLPTVREAILTACRQRLRPILLTSMTTVLGLGPVAYGMGGSDEILKPAALALSWGLFFASFLTLFVIPCFYTVLYETIAALKKGQAKTPQKRDRSA